MRKAGLASRYALAILAALVALSLRHLLIPLLGFDNPYHTAWLAVAFSAWRPPEPVEVAALAVRRTEDGWRMGGRFSSLMRPPPGTPVPAYNVRVTGITEAMLADAPEAAEVFGELDRRLSRPPYRVVAHGAATEAGILRRKREHCPNLAATPLLDTVAMARAVLPDLGSHKLDAVLAHYEIPVPGDRHRAAADVEVTAAIFLRLLEDGVADGRWRDLGGLDRVAGKPPAHQPRKPEPEQLSME